MNAFLLSSLLLIVLSCSPAKGGTTAVKQIFLERANLFVMPLSIIAERNRGIDCPVCATSLLVRSEVPTDPLKLTGFLLDSIRERNIVQIVPLGGIFQDFPDEKRMNFHLYRKEIEEAISSRQTIDAILHGFVLDYRERVGSSFSVSSPAAVSIHLHLVDMQRKVLWNQTSEKTQQALSENLFQLGEFFSSGGKWLTVEDLYRVSLEKMLDDLFGRG